MPPAIELDEPYRSRAAPVGSARHWSLLFAAPDERAALAGIYALLAEWRALTQPDVEAVVAQTKLAWWREEMSRLVAGTGVHPITRYLRSLPGAPSADFAPLADAVEAAALQATGIPLERAADLAAHADALLGGPLRVACALARRGHAGDEHEQRAARALGVAEYLAHALSDYRRDANSGRIAFPVEDLLVLGIENRDLLAVTPSPSLRGFLDRARQQAEAEYRAATNALAQPRGAPWRGLRVLAALGVRRLDEGRPPQGGAPRVRDLFQAWRAARGI
jgi:phytoene synthase